MAVVRDEDDIEVRLLAGRIRLLRRIAARRRGRRAAAAAAMLVVAGSGVAASVVVHRADAETIGTSVTCYAHADLGSLHGTSAMSSAVGAPVRQLSLTEKADMCALVWKSGLEQAAVDGGHWPDIDPNTSTLPVPPLAFCRLADGTTGGFPIEPPATTSRAVCDRLGLPLLT